MNPIRLAAACIFTGIFCAGPTVAQEHDHDHAALGDVNFPVSCTREAQKRFNTAAALLYSFYWERIDGAVADVLAADPTCAMAHWVKAVASLDNPLGSPPTPKLEKEGWAAVAEGEAARWQDAA